jgi:hypothetical protein
MSDVEWQRMEQQALTELCKLVNSEPFNRAEVVKYMDLLAMGRNATFTPSRPNYAIVTDTELRDIVRALVE